MSELNLFSGGGVSRGSYTKGAQATAKGVGLWQPFPLWSSWDSDTQNPPDGLNGGRVRYAFQSGGYIYVIFYHGTGLYNGIARYSVTGTPPTHCTLDGSLISTGTLFGVGHSTAPAHLYDPIEDAVYISRYSSAALTGIVGKWALSSWPFTNGNAEWIAVNSAYGAYSANKVTYYPDSMTLGDGKLFIASGYSGNVITVDASDGSTDGDWAYNTSYSTSYRFNLVGYDTVNDQPVGGSWHASGGNGAIRRWNISNLSSWASASVVLQDRRAGVGDVYEELHCSTPMSLRNASPFYNTDANGLHPGEIASLSFLPAQTYLFYSWVNYIPGLTQGIYEIKEGGAVYHKHCVNSAGRTSGLTGARMSHAAPRVVSSVYGGGAGFWHYGAGTPAILDSNAANKAFCPYFQHCDEGSYVASFTAGAGGAPTFGTFKRLLVDMDATARDREFSCHPGKHAFRYRKNSGAWTDWRAGWELQSLDTVQNGKAAWANWANGDTVEIEHKMTSGLFRHTLPTVYSEESGVSGEEIVSLLDAGAPKEVTPVLVYDQTLADDGKYQGINPTGAAVDLRPAPESAVVL